jgi:LacI family transcriptional regulator
MTTLTIEHIARLANVSRSTVSRVLNEHPSVRPEVRSRVLKVIEEHGYAPQAAARSLASRRTNVITLLIPRSAAVIFSDPFFSHVIQGISETCANRGYFLMLSMMTPDMEPTFYRQFLKGRQFDGIIMLSSDVDDPILPSLINDRIPLVLIGRHPYFDNVTWIDVDNREGGRAATRHLIEHGHRRIATITGPLSMSAAVDRRDGYKQALLEAAIPIDNRLIVEGDFTQESGARAAEQLMALPDPPTAIFAASDMMASGALRALSIAGFSVPGDLSLVSFDGLPISSLSTPQLTTIQQPIYDMGSQAVEALIELLDRPDAQPRQMRLPATLIVRESSGPVPQHPLSSLGETMQKGGASN